MEIKNKYEVIIGLEIHVELSTASKMFCQCSASYFGKEPNTNVCPVCLGLPGALPVPNKKAIEYTMMIGKALNCKINNKFHFDRKHYSYPDLPKGYQISQYDEPIAQHGWYQPVMSSKKFRITRVHLEEDTGKLIHSKNGTYIDFNRSGVPLVEIVTEADFRSADEVKTFVEELQMVVRYLGISQADMEKGSMRLEPNISVKDKTKIKEGELPPYKVELKNINSFRFAKKAIDYEVKRQIELLEEGKVPVQETRGYNEKKGITFTQRVKENADDYRYMPEPDIPYFEFDDKYLNSVFLKVPPVPQEIFTNLIKQRLNKKTAFILMKNKQTLDFFNEVMPELLKKNSEFITPQAVANLIVNEKVDIKNSKDKFISNVIKILRPIQTDKDLLTQVVKKVLTNNPNAVKDFKKGKENVVMFLVGQVMREIKGKAKPQDVIEEIRKSIKD